VHVIVDDSATHKSPRSSAGCSVIRASSSTSRRPTAPGWTSSSAGSPNSRRSGCDAGRVVRPKSWSPRSAPGSLTGTRTRDRSCGTRPATRSSKALRHVASESLTPDTRPPTEMIAFVAARRSEFEIEPICAQPKSPRRATTPPSSDQPQPVPCVTSVRGDPAGYRSPLTAFIKGHRGAGPSLSAS